MSDKIQRWALMGLDYYDVAPLEQKIAKQADELKIAEQGRIALRSKIAEQAAEIERLKVANEGWHRRVQEFGPEKESYQQRIEELEAALRTQKDECERFHKPA